MIRAKVKVDFRWGRKLKVVENVPAGVCQQCGEKYFQSAVYKTMEKLASSQVKPSWCNLKRQYEVKSSKGFHHFLPLTIPTTWNK
ncbi:MAG: YgiT-type zinc finger protein [Candidatus Binatia bacterium]